MNFFERQNQARSKTRLLVFLFFCATIATFFAVHLLVSFFVGSARGSEYEEIETAAFWKAAFFDPTLLGIDFVVVASLILGGSLFKVSELNSLGPDGVANALNGRRVSRTSTDPTERRLLNVVEETALASGVRAPNVYILPDDSVNACAIGGDPNASVIAVTEGALRLLNRDELQGVVAHEFSHILNGDVKINMRLIGVLFGLQMLALIGMTIFRSTFFVSTGNSRDDKGKSAIVAVWAFALGLIVIGAIGVFFSNIIRSAISRQREFLADASAVQFTRNPSGIAGALKKIGAIGSQISEKRSAEMSHLFFGEVFSASFMNALFRSHPPLVERIRRIEPTFDGRFPELAEQSNRYATPTAPPPIQTGREARAAEALKIALGSAVAAQTAESRQVFENRTSENRTVQVGENGAKFANALVDSIGEQAPEKLDVAAELLGAVPSELDAFLVDAASARAVVYAALLDEKSDVRAAQFEILRRKEASGIAEKTQTALNSLENASAATKLCVTNLAFPLLKTLNIADYRRFRQTTLDLCAADGTLDLFEYTIQASILQDLDVYFRLSKGFQVKFSRFDAVAESFETAAAYLARQGNDDAQAAQQAFDAALGVFYLQKPLPPDDALSLGAFSRALNRLAQSSPTLKRELLKAFYRCVAADGVVTEREGALIYAISAALGAPAPIWR